MIEYAPLYNYLQRQGIQRQGTIIPRPIRPLRPTGYTDLPWLQLLQLAEHKQRLVMAANFLGRQPQPRLLQLFQFAQQPMMIFREIVVSRHWQYIHALEEGEVNRYKVRSHHMYLRAIQDSRSNYRVHRCHFE